MENGCPSLRLLLAASADRSQIWVPEIALRRHSLPVAQQRLASASARSVAEVAATKDQNARAENLSGQMVTKPRECAICEDGKAWRLGTAGGQFVCTRLAGELPGDWRKGPLSRDTASDHGVNIWLEWDRFITYAPAKFSCGGGIYERRL